MVLLEVLHAMLVMFVMLHVTMEKKPRETSVVPMWFSAGVEQLPACRLHSAGHPPPPGTDRQAVGCRTVTWFYVRKMAEKLAGEFSVVGSLALRCKL
jgi:hypothetical protein